MSSLVPEGWGQLLIGDMGQFFGGLTGKTAKDFGDGHPFLTYMQVFLQKTSDKERVNFVSINASEKQNRVAYGDILFTTSSETPNEIGMTAVFLETDWSPYLNSFCFGLRVEAPSSIDPLFAKYVLRGDKFREDMRPLAQGSTRFNLSKGNLAKLNLLLPPLPEQKKIASILTSVDEVIENTQKQIDKLQDLKKATMNDLLTKGIGHTEFKDSELGRIPRSWEVIKLSGLCSLHYGKSPKEIEDDDGMYPIYGTGGIVGKTNSALHAGKSIVIGRKGSIDNVSFVDSPLWAIDTTYYVEGKNVEMKWLFYRLQYEGLKKYNEASGVPSLSRDTLYNIAIQSPPASEQTQICVILDTVESHISSLNDKLHQTQSLKKSLMQDLLTGKVRVTVN